MTYWLADRVTELYANILWKHVFNFWHLKLCKSVKKWNHEYQFLRIRCFVIVRVEESNKENFHEKYITQSFCFFSLYFIFIIFELLTHWIFVRKRYIKFNYKNINLNILNQTTNTAKIIMLKKSTLLKRTENSAPRKKNIFFSSANMREWLFRITMWKRKIVNINFGWEKINSY